MSYHFDTSHQLFKRAQKSITGGINSGIRLMEKPHPLFFSHGKGARIWDVDENEFIDYQIGQGAILYGHAPDGFAASLAEQAARGTHWAAQCELEIEVAERLCRFYPSIEEVRFNNSATEAVQAAFRLARAHTGKKYILRFEGHYHGWMDEGLVGFANPRDQWGPESNPSRHHPSEGVIREVLDRHIVVGWNDIEQLKRRVDAFSGEIAAIVFEPINCNTCCIQPVDGLLEAIRELCDREGAVMIADECITGCRFGIGGAQENLGFKPDLTILGKAVGGGLPFAVIGGRKAFMEPIKSGKVVHAGTLNSNPLCLSGSLWCLQELERLKDAHPRDLNARGKKLMGGLKETANRFGIPLYPQGPGAAFHTVILKDGAHEGEILNYRDYVERHDAERWTHIRRCLLEEGVRAIERGLWFVSLAHEDADLKETLERAERAFKRHAETWGAV